jgi:RNA polymerase sigma-70 factor (ECF subfamily)
VPASASAHQPVDDDPVGADRSDRQPVIAWAGPSPAALRAAGDEQLLGHARGDYPPAFEELVRRHQGRAYSVALRMVGDPGDAEDLTQAALVKAWRNLPAFDGRSTFQTWLHRIVVNECLSFLRGRRPTPAPDDHDTPSDADTQHIVETSERDEALRRSVQALPADQRAALVLTSYLGHSHDEAAATLGVPASTVRGRTARARRTLLMAMKEWA